MESSPPQASQRAQLLRELSKDLSRSRMSLSPRPSPPPSNVSINTVSDFDPTNEALNSTRQIDNTTKQLPQIRSTARRFGYYNPPEPAVQLDTSVLERQFEDFSHSNEEEDQSLESIEMGRGLKKGTASIGDVSFSAPISFGDNSNYEITTTPPARPRPAQRISADGAVKGNLRKDAQLRRASAMAQLQSVGAQGRPLKANEFAAKQRRVASGEQRRTLTEIHAKVTAEDDGSLISDERPATVTLQAKTTRFGSSKLRQTSVSTVPKRFSAQQGLEQASGAPIVEVPHQNTNPSHTATTTGNATQQSFALPDLPNITELMSGVWQDGTPVFSRTNRSRSRFVSAAHPRPKTNSQNQYLPLESIPVPEEEKAIFVSLQLLKDKVQQLEQHKSEAEKRIEEYENEVFQLRAEVETQRKARSDSALGETDEEDGRGGRDWQMEKKHLGTTVKSLQSRLNRAERKESVADISLKRMAQERDSLVTQLGVAYYNSEELKNEINGLRNSNEDLQDQNEDLLEENDILRSENEALKEQFRQLAAKRSEEAQQWSRKEDVLRGKISRREEAVREMRDMTRELFEVEGRDARTVLEKKSSKREVANDKETRAKVMETIVKEAMRTGPEDSSTKPPTEINRHRSSSKPRKATVEEGSGDGKRVSSSKQAATSMPQAEESVVESTTDLGIVRNPTRTIQRQPTASQKIPQAAPEGDITYLSFLDGEEIAKLRKTLEEERLSRRNHPSAFHGQEETVRSASAPVMPARAPSLPRKSSLKDLTGDFTTGTRVQKGRRGSDHTGRVSLHSRYDGDVSSDDEHVDDGQAYTQRDATNASKMSTASRRSRRNVADENMTSAFILPDITLRARPELTANAKNVFNVISPHDTKNCTICQRVLCSCTATNTSPIADVKIPTPIPVSQRPPQPSADNTSAIDATIRPSQPPSLALATIIKQLQDEVTHLKHSLSEYEALYIAHDPSLSKRKRQSLQRKIQELVREIERRSDQVYALFDVLEGQKGDMGEKEVEETLMSVGISREDLERKGVTVDRKNVAFESDGESEELPWEGISEDEEEIGQSRR